MSHTLSDWLAEALDLGLLTPELQQEIDWLCSEVEQLRPTQRLALEQLASALESGELLLLDERRLINVMGDWVRGEVWRQLRSGDRQLDSLEQWPRIAALALQRLPPLYATSRTAARQLRERHHDQLQPRVAEAVWEAIAAVRQSHNRPNHN